MPVRQTKRSLEQAILHTAIDGIVTIDEDGIVRTFNPACERLFGYEAGEIIGRNVNMLMPAPYREEHDGYLRRYRETGERRIIGIGREVAGRKKDGSGFPLYLSVGEWVDDDGSRLFVGVLRDITDLKEAEERLLQRQRALEASNKELDGFTYSVSHDLRAPLRAIDGFGRILLEDHAGQLDAEGRRVLEVIRRSVAKMGQLIDDLLAFSRLGRDAMKPSRVDMTTLARTVLEEITAAEPDRAIDARVAHLPDVLGDPTLLRQVWVNLLSNAVKYTRRRSPAVIQVTGRTEKTEVVYAVRDNGVGFDMAYVGKLFGVFQRLHNASEFEGTGVGLALVHRIVTRHGGLVWAEAQPDKGATFSFALPRKDQ